MWKEALQRATWKCPKTIAHDGAPFQQSGPNQGFTVTSAGGGQQYITAAYTAGGWTEIYPAAFLSYSNPAEGRECLASLMAHERLHSIMSDIPLGWLTPTLGDIRDYLRMPMLAPHLYPFGNHNAGDLDGSEREWFVKSAQRSCFHCTTIQGLDFGAGPNPNLFSVMQ
jgi:hypothetical protein